MTGYRQAHQHSDNLALEAERCLASKKPDKDKAKKLYARAAGFEQQARDAVPDGKPRTYGALALSVVALLYKAEQYAECEMQAEVAMQKTGLDEYVYDEIRQLSDESRMKVASGVAAHATADPGSAAFPEPRDTAGLWGNRSIDVIMSVFTEFDVRGDPDHVWRNVMRGDLVLLKREDSARVTLTRSGVADVTGTIDWEDYVGAETDDIYARVSDHGQRIALQRGRETIYIVPLNAVAPKESEEKTAQLLEDIGAENEWLIGPTKVSVQQLEGIIEVQL